VGREGLGWYDVQVTWTSWLSEGAVEVVPSTGDELMKTYALPEAPLPGFTVTTSVTDWPAWSVPWLPLTVRAEELLADQLTGPPWAVRVSWPAELGPRFSWSGVTVSVPVGLGALDVLADGEAEV
jgi:hypothetical protein